MVSKTNQKDVLREQEFNYAMFPFKRLLKDVSTEDLIKFNTVISNFSFPEEGTPLDFIHELGKRLGFFLLQAVPDDPKLNVNTVENYFPVELKALLNSLTLHLSFFPNVSEESGQFVKENWPNIGSPVALKLGKIIDSFEEALSDATIGPDQYRNFILTVAGKQTERRQNRDFPAAFNRLYRDIISRRQEIFQYLGPDIIKIADKYLLQ